MSTEIGNMTAKRGTIQLTQFAGKSDEGRMIQITQGHGTAIGPNTPGFIQLTRLEAGQLAHALNQWAFDTSALFQNLSQTRTPP